MKKDVINLYVLADSNCPKCAILKSKFEKSKYIKNNDSKVIDIDVSDTLDSNLHLLLENKITDMPVMLVNNKFYSFGESMKLLEEKDNG